jgi:hypothetical protein
MPLHDNFGIPLVHRVLCVFDGSTPTTTATASDVRGVQANRIDSVNRIPMLEILGVPTPIRMILVHQMAQIATHTNLISCMLAN